MIMMTKTIVPRIERHKLRHFALKLEVRQAHANAIPSCYHLERCSCFRSRWRRRDRRRAPTAGQAPPSGHRNGPSRPAHHPEAGTIGEEAKGDKLVDFVCSPIAGEARAHLISSPHPLRVSPECAQLRRLVGSNMDGYAVCTCECAGS